MTPRKIMLVDDRIKSLKGLVAILEDEGYEVKAVDSGTKALAVFESEPDIAVILADLKMPSMDGLELFRRMKVYGDVPPFVIMTAYGAIRSAVEALKEGVTDYLIKPLDYEELGIILDKAVRERENFRELVRLRGEATEDNRFHGMIGACRSMRELFSLIRRVGPTEVAVLITGETGTGKELAAGALHAESTRQGNPMVCINCAALTESLLEAELFGHVRGAFTGAVADKKGRLEAANGGTLFLDEIGHMSLPLQAKLLRFLQDQTFEPVGGSASRKVDVRIVSATNMSLEKEINKGRFLSDLLYRLDVISLHLPPLRERQEDLPLLVDHFLRLYTRQYAKRIDQVDTRAMKALIDYTWPGNVREMENVLARAVILSQQDRLTMDDLPARFHPVNDPRSSCTRSIVGGELPEDGVSLQDMERDLIRLTLAKCSGNKSQTAKLLGISRKALYQKMQRLGLEIGLAVDPPLGT
jgi:DNA-binding NtrC family response regulator